ncbi:hypothetical protein HYU10_05170 [Candidatus Woesearchaeota archaeon]|nr:hypothetical protein [Candidatus Woesearchaeota archaeon]
MFKEKATLSDMIKKIIDIVEGKKDSAALRKLGIINIIELSKRPIYSIVEEIAGKTNDCIILTDLDRKGKELFSKLNSGLQRHGVRVDNTFREFLFKRTKLRQIEGITEELEVF